LKKNFQKISKFFFVKFHLKIKYFFNNQKNIEKYSEEFFFFLIKLISFLSNEKYFYIKLFFNFILLLIDLFFNSYVISNKKTNNFIKEINLNKTYLI